MAAEIPFVRDLTFDYGKVDQVTPLIRRVIAENPGPVADVKAGTEKAIGFLVGQVMKLSKGQANPGMVNQLLREKLK